MVDGPRITVASGWLIACLFALPVLADDILVGPATEDRFPPLVIPEGFRATLFACDPLVEYPSVIAIGPRPGTLFVAHDYMTGLGEEIIRRDEIRLLADTDGDGYADQSTLYAEGFNSIQGLAFDGEYVYAMHAPYLTRVRDADGDGAAEERTDLLDGLGLPPEENPNRLHCANGVTIGHDGWLYLALGDRGCDTQRPEGDRLVFQQGGILRCRPDGTDLHVFSSGLRNIYDVALDAELNVFVRDNENDGGDYLLRVCHCFFGSDHGYPYHYYERPDELMPPLVELGRGSSAGVTTYLETAFPEEYRSSLYACEWGRAVVRYPLVESGSGFAPTQEIDFAAGAADDPYGFHPTDLVVDYDGSLLISDWCDGQRPMRGRGRIYRIEAEAPGEPAEIDMEGLSDVELVASLDSPSYHERVAAQREILKRDGAIDELQAAWNDGQLGRHGQMHAIWISVISNESFKYAQVENESPLLAQTMRGLGDVLDPMLLTGRLDTQVELTPFVPEVALMHRDPRVVREMSIILARVKYEEAVSWLQDVIDPSAVDPALSHAAVQLLRRSDNWPPVLALLDAPPDSDATLLQLRQWALFALAEQDDPDVVDGLIERLAAEPLAERRIEYIDLLSRVARLPAPWTYWGFRPAPRPANTEVWERTEAIELAITQSLADPDMGVRAFALERMMREDLPVAAASLAAWLNEETNPQHVAVILSALAEMPIDESLPLLKAAVSNANHSSDNRFAALAVLSARLEPLSEHCLLAIAESIEDGPLLAVVLSEFASRTNISADELLLSKLDSPVAEVRAAAVHSLTARRTVDVREHLEKLLNDASIEVIREAVAACDFFETPEHADRILELAAQPDDELQRNCLLALRTLEHAGAVSIAVAALENDVAQLAALEYLERFGDSSHVDAVEGVAATTQSIEIQRAAVSAIRSWASVAEPEVRVPLHLAIARIQGRSGTALCWHVVGPLASDTADAMLMSAFSQPSRLSAATTFDGSTERIAVGADALVELNLPASESTAWLAAADVFVDEATDVEILASSAGTLSVWINEDLAFQRAEVAEYRPNSDTFTTQLPAGSNRIIVRVDAMEGTSQFHLAFRRVSSKAEHEQLMQFVLTNAGDAGRGREVFINQEKSQCLRCHRMGSDGGRIGPDLTGIGSRFSRIHILESILEPSRTIAPSYATVAVALTDGRIITGIPVEPGAGSGEQGVAREAITIGDNEGKLHEIVEGEIEDIVPHDVSTMPLGLEQRMTQQELLDLIEYLTQQRE